VEDMLALRIKHEQHDLNTWRWWTALRRFWLQGLPAYAEAPPDKPGYGDKARLDAFLKENAFTSAVDVGKDGNGVSPLMCAAVAGDVGIVRSLLAEGADANVVYKGKGIEDAGLVRGSTALHMTAAYSTGSAPCVELLLRHDASLDVRAGLFGGTPLHAAAAVSEDAVRALAKGCLQAEVPLNIHAGSLLNNASALSVAVYMGTPGAVATLLELGADASHVTNHGGYLWHDACQNAQMDAATLELIKRRAGVKHINTAYKPRKLKWIAVDHVSELLERAGRGKGELVRVLANTRGSTALHWAASTGRLDLVQWLLENGAESSLTVRNARGRTAVQMSRVFGPHIAVEAELVGYQPSSFKK